MDGEKGRVWWGLFYKALFAWIGLTATLLGTRELGDGKNRHAFSPDWGRDVASVIIKFKSGAIFSLDSTTATLASMSPTFEILGTEGVISACTRERTKVEMYNMTSLWSATDQESGSWHHVGVRTGLYSKWWSWASLRIESSKISSLSFQAKRGGYLWRWSSEFTDLINKADLLDSHLISYDALRRGLQISRKRLKWMFM